MVVTQAQLWIAYGVIAVFMLFFVLPILTQTAFSSMILYVVGILFCLFALHGGEFLFLSYSRLHGKTCRTRI